MELIKFACPQCGAPLPIPVGLVSKCHYCGMTVAIEAGRKAATEKSKNLADSLSAHPYLAKPYEKLSESFYSERVDAAAVFNEAMYVVSELLLSYDENYEKYLIKADPVNELLVDLMYITQGAINDLISANELYVDKFTEAQRELYRRFSWKDESDWSDELWEKRRINRVSLPNKLEKEGYGVGANFEFCSPSYGIGEFEKAFSHVTCSYRKLRKGKIVTDSFAGYLPAVAYVVRYLYYPQNENEGKNPPEVRLQFFSSRQKVANNLINHMSSLIALKKNWIRPSRSEEIEDLLNCCRALFSPYEYSRGFMKKEVDKDLYEIYNSLGSVLQEFMEIKDIEPLRRLNIR